MKPSDRKGPAMKDIVERLREAGSPEAANEIERLRKALKLYHRRDGKLRECVKCDGMNYSDCRKNGCARARRILNNS